MKSACYVMRYVIALAATWVCLSSVQASERASSQPVRPEDSSLVLMPWPQQVIPANGELVLGKEWKVALTTAKPRALKQTLARIAERASRQTGVPIRVRYVAPHQATLHIHIHDNAGVTPTLASWDESYVLVVNKATVSLTAAQWMGAQRGLETFLQLLGQSRELRVPQVKITDAPRFPWRGVLLDSSRHFLPIDVIKRQIDAMAAAKFNIFHWHLTDDQGWRFESRRYPNLHRLASDGDYYTRAQMKEIVAYAAARGMAVLPEIDMPGHASAIAVAYPDLMSAPGPYAMEYRWGVHKPLLDPSNEAVYQFVDGILGELAAIFPFNYVHIGGDEVDPTHWNDNEAIQAFMAANALTDSGALHAYFNRRVQTLVEKHGRHMIGWDEIQHPDLGKNVMIQSWQGPDGVSRAIASGYPTLLSTGFYLDQPQFASYHYRNDPVPPAPVVIDTPLTHVWAFSMARKRGKPVSGEFALLPGASPRVIVQFRGYSAREARVIGDVNGTYRFALDTWMGPVEFHAVMNNASLGGIAVVGNSPYPLTGESLDAPKVLNVSRSAAVISAESLSLIKGGEVALWGEIADASLMPLRLWPRAFVAAERLWSARDLLNEPSMYERMEAMSIWADISVNLGIAPAQQQKRRELVGDANVDALNAFIEVLEPAHYYHRHHEKSVHESYSRRDPLNRLADALPAEQASYRDVEKRLRDWLVSADNEADYGVLQQRVSAWQAAGSAMQPLLEKQPTWTTLVGTANAVHHEIRVLLTAKYEKRGLTTAQRDKCQQLIARAHQIDQEMIVASGRLLAMLLDSFE